MAQAQVPLGIEGDAMQQARTNEWDQEVLGKENHAGEMCKTYRSHSVQSDSNGSFRSHCALLRQMWI